MPMAQPNRQVVSIADLTRLQEQDNRPAAATVEEVQDYAIAALVVLRGLTRADKLKIIRRMRRLVG